MVTPHHRRTVEGGMGLRGFGTDRGTATSRKSVSHRETETAISPSEITSDEVVVFRHGSSYLGQS